MSLFHAFLRPLAKPCNLRTRAQFAVRQDRHIDGPPYSPSTAGSCRGGLCRHLYEVLRNAFCFHPILSCRKTWGERIKFFFGRGVDVDSRDVRSEVRKKARFATPQISVNLLLRRQHSGRAVRSDSFCKKVLACPCLQNGAKRGERRGRCRDN
jgi:hypothetical protein